MIDWLIKHFVEGKCDGDPRKRRLLCGRMSGVTGIVLYAVFGLVKIFIGLATGSFAVIADAIHNLADASASIATLLGFSMASKASDKEHPFGHARIEYMTGFVVSAIIIGIGIELCMTAIEKIQKPTPLNSDLLSIILIIVLTLIVIWFSRFNVRLSKFIGSVSLKATSVEARNDAITNIAIMAVILLDRYADINIDAYVGLAVGVLIIHSGLKMIKETAGPLLGQTPDPEIVREIVDLILSRKGVLGIHDLIVHDYGPGHIFASVHIEVDSREDIFRSHTLIDDIERQSQEELRVFLVGHMDPLDTQNPKIAEVCEALESALYKIDGVISFHDVRIVTRAGHTKVILDVVAAHDDPERTFRKVEETAQATLSALDPSYITVINRDLDYGSDINENLSINGN